MSLDPKDGKILALVGGYDFYSSNYNRVFQAKPQLGSNFKPFLYSAAFENGYNPSSIILDAPIVFEDENLRYYVFVKDFKINGSVSPLELEQDKIRNVLLNKNKIEYLKQLEDELYQNGLAMKKIKIY